MTEAANTNDLVTKVPEGIDPRILALEARVAALEGRAWRWPAYPPYYQPWYPATPVWSGTSGSQA